MLKRSFAARGNNVNQKTVLGPLRSDFEVVSGRSRLRISCSPTTYLLLFLSKQFSVLVSGDRRESPLEVRSSQVLFTRQQCFINLGTRLFQQLTTSIKTVSLLFIDSYLLFNISKTSLARSGCFQLARALGLAISSTVSMSIALDHLLEES